MEIDLKYISELVQAILLATLPVLAAQGSAYLLKAYQVKRSELETNQRWMLDNVVQIAVTAAEQVYKNGDGEDKKAYALSIAEKYLKSKGLEIDLAIVSAHIESAVYEQIKKQPPYLRNE
jgi:hypothetical protein